MKLVRYGDPNAEKFGLLDRQGKIRTLDDALVGITHEVFSPDWIAQLQALDPEKLPILMAERRLGAPLPRPLNFVCIGLNYADHAAETGGKIPKEPIVFLKSLSAFSGPYDDIRIPRGSKKTDWEVELGVVIGTKASYVSEAEALDHVAGYCVCNDVSERNFQIERLGQWTKGKSHDTFGPLGPWLVTKDEIADVQQLPLWLDVNGERRQTGSTSTMIFSIAKCIAYVSQFMTLLPGDIVTTGTPPGVGAGMKPPKFLDVGDVVTLGIEGLGEQRQEIVAA